MNRKIAVLFLCAVHNATASIIHFDAAKKGLSSAASSVQGFAKEHPYLIGVGAVATAGAGVWYFWPSKGKEVKSRGLMSADQPNQVRARAEKSYLDSDQESEMSLEKFIHFGKEKSIFDYSDNIKERKGWASEVTDQDIKNKIEMLLLTIQVFQEIGNFNRIECAQPDGDIFFYFVSKAHNSATPVKSILSSATPVKSILSKETALAFCEAVNTFCEKENALFEDLQPLMDLLGLKFNKYQHAFNQIFEEVDKLLQYR